MKIQQNSINVFYLEFFIIGSSIFVLVPTFLIIKAIFRDFTKTKKSKNNKESAYKNVSEGKKAIFINFAKWNRKKDSFIVRLHCFLILNLKFALPIILFTMTLFKKTYYIYFELYVIYHIFYHSFIKKNDKTNQRYKKIFDYLNRLFQVFVFVFYISMISLILLGRVNIINNHLITIIFLLRTRSIFDNTVFLKYNKDVIIKNQHLKNELRMYIRNMNNNEKLLLQRIVHQIKYDKIITFVKYKAKNKFFTLNKTIKTNFKFFNRIFSKNIFSKLLSSLYYEIFFNFKFNTDELYWEDTFYILILLFSKYQNIANLKFNIFEILTFNYNSAFDTIEKINILRNMIQYKNKAVVTKMVECLKELEQTKEYKIKKDDFDAFDFKNFEDINDGKSFMELSKDIYTKFLKNKDHKGSFYTEEIKTEIDSRTNLVIFNYKYNHIICKDGLPAINYLSFLKVAWSFLIKKCDRFIVVFILFLLTFYSGAISLFIIIYMLFGIIFDKSESEKVRKIFRLYIFYFGVILIKHVLNYIPISKKYQYSFNLFCFTFGNIQNLRNDFILVFSLYILINVYSGRWNKRFFPKKEFPGESCYRITLNNSVGELGNKFNFSEVKILDYFQKQLDDKVLKNNKEYYIKHLRFYLKETVELKSKIIANSAKVIETLKQFNSKRNYRRNKHFLWRNFSYHNVNYGSDHLLTKIIIMLIFILYSAIYFLIYDKKIAIEDIQEFSHEKTVDFTFLLFFTLSILMILYDIIFFNYQSIRWNFKTKIFNELTVFSQPEKRGDLTLRQRFVKAVKKVININYATRNLFKKNKIKDDYENNTYKRKFLVNLTILSAMLVACYIWIPCYDEELIRYSLTYLIKTPKDLRLRFLLFIMIIYMFIDLSSSNIDKISNYDSILNTDFENRLNKVIFKIYSKVPFLMEIKTILNFISSKTSLNILKWYKIEDIKNILINAVYINESLKRKDIGVEEPIYIRFIFSYGFFTIFFVILVAPFFIFSTFNPLVANIIVEGAALSIQFKAIENGLVRNAIKIAKTGLFEKVELNSEETKVFTSHYLHQALDEDKIIKLRALLNSSEMYDYNTEAYQEFSNLTIDIEYVIEVKVS